MSYTIFVFIKIYLGYFTRYKMNALTLKFNMESFYFSTHLPIKAFSTEGEEYHSVGYDKTSDLSLKELDFNDLISKIYSDKKINSPIDISPIEDVNFTVCPIVSKNYEHGFYLIGPYTTNDASSKAIFKPKHCIIYLLNILYIKLENIDDNTSSKTSYNFNVNKAIKYIEENYKKPITLDEVCSNININKSYFCTIFKEHTGKTFSHYLSHYRVDKSKELLKDTDLSITEVALTVGYNSVNYFNNNFKRFNNITPVQYRNEINNLK